MKRRNDEYINLIGKKFGNLLVIGCEDEIENIRCHSYFICECQCKNKTVIKVKGFKLLGGHKDNCGCQTKEKQRNAKRKFNKYIIKKDVCIGFTNKGEKFYLDSEDFEKIKKYCWVKHSGYIETRTPDSNYSLKMHRFLMNATKTNQIIDHISRDTTDNRKSNLRIVTVRENSFNAGERINSTSGIRGISWRSDNKKWRVRIGIDYKEISVGNFEKLEDAIVARISAEKKYYGEYARTDSYAKLHFIPPSF